MVYKYWTLLHMVLNLELNRAGSVLKPNPKRRFSVEIEPKPTSRFRWESKSVLRPH